MWLDTDLLLNISLYILLPLYFILICFMVITERRKDVRMSVFKVINIVFFVFITIGLILVKILF